MARLQIYIEIRYRASTETHLSAKSVSFRIQVRDVTSIYVLHKYPHLSVWVCVSECVCVHASEFACMCWCVCVCVCMCVCVRVCVLVCV